MVADPWAKPYGVTELCILYLLFHVEGNMLVPIRPLHGMPTVQWTAGKTVFIYNGRNVVISLWASKLQNNSAQCFEETPVHFKLKNIDFVPISGSSARQRLNVNVRLLFQINSLENA